MKYSPSTSHRPDVRAWNGYRYLVGLGSGSNRDLTITRAGKKAPAHQNPITSLIVTTQHYI
ncbi:MAG: hypothetical protein L0229_25370 [Blastocatellia bacterium]|nr:hypothetical protein [Blastocatellia bacterium]